MRLAILLGFIFGLTHGAIVSESYSANNYENNQLFFIQKNSNLNFEDFFISYCPERVLPGNILYELVHNDRVIGGISEACSREAKSLYEVFLKGQCFISNARTAEMVKLTENASRDVQIAFANELSMICSDLEIDTTELIRIANCHPRVNVVVHHFNA